jgi:hypothetical protein
MWDDVPPSTTAAFTLPGAAASFTVVRGDATRLVADVGVVGRVRAVAQLARLASERWRVTEPPRVRRRVSIADAPEGTSWRRGCVLHYRSRDSELAVPWQRRFLNEPPPHANGLATDVLHLFSALSGWERFDFVILPLSCRNPDVVAAASVAAAVELAHTHRAARLRFAFCDMDGHTPFLRFLQDHDHALGKFLNQWSMTSGGHARFAQRPMRVLDRHVGEHALHSDTR